MKYATITGWTGDAGDAGEKFHNAMRDRVKNYDNWNRDAVESELFARCEEQLTGGESMDYELSQFETVSGHTELMSFDPDEFEVEWKEAEE